MAQFNVNRWNPSHRQSKDALEFRGSSDRHIEYGENHQPASNRVNEWSEREWEDSSSRLGDGKNRSGKGQVITRSANTHYLISSQITETSGKKQVC